MRSTDTLHLAIFLNIIWMLSAIFFPVVGVSFAPRLLSPCLVFGVVEIGIALVTLPLKAADTLTITIGTISLVRGL